MSYLEDQLYTHTGHRLLLIGNNEDFLIWQKLIEECRVELKVPWIVNFFFRKRSNDGFREQASVNSMRVVRMLNGTSPTG